MASSSSSRMRRSVVFKNGERVEVSRNNDSSRWFRAVVVCLSLPAAADKHKEDKVLVEYDDAGGRNLHEYVSAASVRPVPPLELQQQHNFKAGDCVDAFHVNAWQRGKIVDVIGAAMAPEEEEEKSTIYLVSFAADQQQEAFPFQKGFLRPHRDWDHASACWLPAFSFSFQQQQQLITWVLGTRVEVKSIEEGYMGAWYTAVIVGSMGKDRFIVEYETLKTEDQSGFLQEKTDAFSIRPCPPEMRRPEGGFKLFEKVDTWFNDGWWVGVVSRVNVDGESRRNP